MIKQIIYTSVRLLHLLSWCIYCLYVLNIFIYFSANDTVYLRFIYYIDNLFASDINISCEHTHIKLTYRCRTLFHKTIDSAKI